MEAWLMELVQTESENLEMYIALLRWLVPALSLLLLIRCARPLLTFRRAPEIWGWLYVENGQKLAITHWENVIGRSKRSDLVLDFPTVSRSHAVLNRYDDGSWTIYDADSKAGIMVNGEKVQIAALHFDDVINVGGIDMTLVPISQKQEKRLAQLRSRASGKFRGAVDLAVLSVLQLMICMGFLMTCQPEDAVGIFRGFAGIFLCQWLLFLFYLCIRRSAFEVETLAFFLSTIGMAAIASVIPRDTGKQLIAMVMGLVLFLVLGWILRDLERARKLRKLVGAVGIAMLLVTLVFGTEYYGAKNWLLIGSLTLQPSELTKVCFVFVGASTMDQLLRRRNLISFIAYSVCICGCLAMMNDFGTALIFFCAFLIAAFIRSGSIGTIALACTSLAYVGVLAGKLLPHAMDRFSAWRHVWEDPLDAGYQQTRAMICIASGGLFGVGVNQGWLERVFAADSDIVFATVSEEWGLAVASICVISLLVLGIFVVRSAAVGRSSYYTIAACTAVGILLVQCILNVLGTVDVLPLTGVTFPFLSNGGSSMLCSWGLLAFVKAADTRQDASFAVAAPVVGEEVADE